MKEKAIFMMVNYTPEDKSLGITKKINGVINAFKRKGYIVFFSAYGNEGIEIFNNDEQIIFEKKYSFGNGIISGMTRRFDLLNTCRSFMSDTTKHFDIVFMRYLGFDKTYIKLLQTFKAHGAYIMIDMHSYFKGIKSRTLKGIYMNFNTDLYHKYAMNYIDILLTEGNEDILFGQPTIRALIGIDINNCRQHIYKGTKDELNLIAVANETSYHGYDRLINSLIKYYNLKENTVEIKLHLVGVMSEETVKIVKSNEMNQHVILYGKQFGTKLMDIYDKCNMAVGPLGQHRIGGKKDPGLKTKEYFGIGIPYFYAGIDSTIPNKYPYVFLVPSDESLINFDEIITFYNSYKDNVNVSKEMREYAIENYSWDKITDGFLLNYKQ